jgi:hypothetical protein
MPGATGANVSVELAQPYDAEAREAAYAQGAATINALLGQVDLNRIQNPYVVQGDTVQGNIQMAQGECVAYAVDGYVDCKPTLEHKDKAKSLVEIYREAKGNTKTA